MPALALELLGIACLLFASAAIFTVAAGSTPLHGDEGQYIYTAHYFDYLFLEHDITRDEWSTNYWTMTQPMLTRYIIGASLWLHGDDLSMLPQPYDFTETTAENAADGRLPSAVQLADARAGMVLFACGAILGLYALTRTLGGALAGFMAAGLALASPLTAPLLVRAWAEAPTLFFLLWSLTLTVLAARSAAHSRSSAGWAVLAGIALGLGLGVKLTILMSLASIALWGGAIVAMNVLRLRSERSKLSLQQVVRTGRPWLLAGCVALVVFIVSDPYLYRNPLRNTAHLFTDRANEMRLMRDKNPQFAPRDLSSQASFALVGTLVREMVGGPPARDEDFGPMPLADSAGPPFAVPFVLVGIGKLVAASRRYWKRERRLPAEGLVMLTMAVYLVGTCLTMGVYIERYLLPTLYLAIVLAALGASAVARKVFDSYQPYRSRLATRSPAT